MSPELASIVISSLNWVRQHHGVIVYAYCLMPDHLHLLLRLGDVSPSLGDVVAAMKKHTTRESWRLGWEGKLWQDRFYDHILRTSEDAHEIATYIMENPVRKGLVEVAERYRWKGTPDPM